MPAEASKSRDVKRINLVDDEDPSILAKVRVEQELAGSLQDKVVRLEARLSALESENTELKLLLKERDLDLKDTQAMLGQLMVTANRQGQTNPIAGPSRRPEPPQKRARSPSLEIVESLEPTRKKQKEKTDDTPPATTTVRSRGKPFVSLLRRKIPLDLLMAESLSQPLTSSLISKPATQSVVSISTVSSKSPATPKKPKLTPPQTSSPTLKAVKTSPSEKKHKIEPEKRDNLAPQSKTAKAKVSREGEEGSSNDDSSSSAESSTSSGPKPSSLPKEEKPKPVIKVKTKDVFTLPDATVQQYLQSAQAFKITPPPLDLEVPRTFLRLAYGGSDQHFLQFIQQDMNPSGPVQRRIVFPMLDMNPAMPSRPGEPGLVFASRHEILSNLPWTLFCKRSNEAPAVWIYLGEYDNVLCGTMTAAQFKSQTLVVKKEWAKLILRMKAFDVYVSMRARIALRVAGTIPVEDKEVEENLVNAEMRAVKNDKGLRVTEEDVITAFSNGDEGIDIIRMTCVKYDHIFANDMKAKFANYDTLLAANKRKKEGKGKGKDKSATGKATPKKPGRKPKAQTQTQTQAQLDALDVDEESERDPSGNSDEEFVVPTGPSSSRGLRPRRSSRKSVSVEGYFEDFFGGALTDIDDD